MEHNVGNTDKIIRYIIGAIFLYLGYTYSPWLYILGVGSIITAITGFCGLYKLLGVKTCPIDK